MEITVNTITERLRRQQALQLRVEGKNYREIGEIMGVTPEGARKICTRAMKNLEEKLTETVIEARTLDLMRLDAMIAAAWQRATDPDGKDLLAAMGTVNSLIRRRAEVFGYDAAKKMEHSGEVGIREYTGIDPNKVS